MNSYLVIFIVGLHNSLAFVNFTYIALECVTIVGIFAATRRLFGDMPALIAATLLAFGSTFISEATHFLFQPYVMEPFLAFGAYFLIRGIQERSMRMLVASISLTFFALAIHLSVLAVFPVYCALVAIAAWRIDGRRAVLQLGAFGVVLATLLFSLPVLNQHQSHLPAHLDVAEFVTNLSHLFRKLGSDFLQYSGFGITNVWFAPSLFALLLTAYFADMRIQTQHKKALFLLSLCVVIQVCAAALVGTLQGPLHDAGFHDISPAILALAMIIGAVVGDACARFSWRGIVAWLTILIWVALLVRGPYLGRSIFNIFPEKHPHQETITEAAGAIQRTVYDLQRQNGYSDLRFFDIAIQSGNTAVRSAVLWEPLEKLFRTPFVVVDDYDYRGDGLSPINSNRVIFLACFYLSKPYTNSDCVNTFSAHFPSHHIKRAIFDDPSLTIFLAQWRIQWDAIRPFPVKSQ